MSYQFIPGERQFIDSNGDPLGGGKVYFWEAGTSNFKNTYPTEADALAETSPNTNPVVLDSSGKAAMFLVPGGVYKYELTTSADVSVEGPIDNISDSTGEFPDWGSVVTAVYVDANTYKIESSDVTTAHHTGRRFQTNGASPIYGKIDSSSFSTDTTVDVIVDAGGVLPADMTTIALGPDVDDASSQGQYYPTGSGETGVTNNTERLYTPERYGAVGDDTTDDLVALTAAIKSDREIYLSKTYYISAELSISTIDDFTITGPGKIRCGVAGNVLKLDTCNRFRIDGPTFEGIRTFLTGTGAINLVTCTDFKVVNCSTKNSSRQGIKVETCTDGVIANNLVELSYQDGIMVRTDSARITVTGNTVYDCGLEHMSNPIGEGIHVFDATGITITGNNIYNCFDNGIALEGANDTVVSGNVIIDSGQSGISLNDQTNTGHDVVVSGNNIAGSGKDGIVVSDIDNAVIVGNLITDSGNYGIQHGIDSGEDEADNIIMGNIIRTSTLDGIILNWNSNDIIVANNHVRGANGTGILINRSTNVDTLVTGNNVTGFPVAQITDSGTTSTIHHNKGYVTENKGTGSITSATTTDVITHGLSYTPTEQDIQIVFIEQGDNDYGRWWISGITSTQFTVNVTSDPGASNLDFGWKAAIE
jgi:parallel beta-helix repeat protein